MDDLIAFITARLDEDEAIARAAQAPSPWKAADDESDTWIVTDATGEPLIYDEGTPSLEEAAHIARHDPARVLREVAALRWLATLMVTEGSTRALRRIAAVWSDHTDYQSEWAFGS